MDQSCEEAFHKLKRRLTTAPVLTLPEDGVEFDVFCDTSKMVLGCVLMQNRRVVAYALQQLKVHEVNYPTHDLELSIVVHALKMWRHYLIGVHCQIYTNFKRKANVVAEALSRKSTHSLSVIRVLPDNLCTEFPKLSLQLVESGFDYLVKLLEGKAKDCEIDASGYLHYQSRMFIPIKETWSLDRLGSAYVEEIVRYHGVPKKIVSDRDLRFCSRFWKALQDAMGCTLLMSTAFHAATDGQTEWTIQTLEDLLRACALDFHTS
ncbi:uncharacterized protein LOC141629270 [Silene latifolia]|uniref:uncharacterized protein LOC141629270 n=1 Tax=Silene latifolia TaxID=37657 RepID=UPI003D76D582